MVDVSAKSSSLRQAKARCQVRLSEECLDKLVGKGVDEIISTARVAGIQAAKQTASLIPMCHPIQLTAIDVDIQLDRSHRLFRIEVQSRASDVTGVEMEALVGASVAGLTIYDMIKAVDPGATILNTEVVEKRGGKAGHWLRPECST